MSEMMAAGVLVLFTIDLGIAFGAGVYEHRIVVPRWIVGRPGAAIRWDAEAAREDDTGRRFWVCVTTVPLTVLTVVSVVVAWGAAGTGWNSWLAAALVAAAERTLTFAYFIPAMVRLMSADDESGARAAALRWRRVNHLRHVLTLAAWLLALHALATFDVVASRP